MGDNTGIKVGTYLACIDTCTVSVPLIRTYLYTRMYQVQATRVLHLLRYTLLSKHHRVKIGHPTNQQPFPTIPHIFLYLSHRPKLLNHLEIPLINSSNPSSLPHLPFLHCWPSFLVSYHFILDINSCLILQIRKNTILSRRKKEKNKKRKKDPIYIHK